MSQSAKFMRCSFCRYIVFYACRKQLQDARPQRKILAVPFFTSLRQLSTTSVLYRRKRPEDYESSSSSSDSDREDENDVGFRDHPARYGHKGKEASKEHEQLTSQSSKQTASNTGPKKRTTLFMSAEGEPLTRSQLDEEILKAADAVAHELEGDPIQTKEDLLKMIKQQAKTTVEQKMGKAPQSKISPLDLLETMQDSEVIEETELKVEKEHLKIEKKKSAKSEAGTREFGDQLQKRQDSEVIVETELPLVMKDIKSATSEIEFGDLLQSMSGSRKPEEEVPIEILLKEEVPPVALHKETSASAQEPAQVAKKEKKKKKKASDVVTADLGDLLKDMAVADIEAEEREHLVHIKAEQTAKDLEDGRPDESEKKIRRKKQAPILPPNDWFILNGEYTGEGLNIFTKEDLETDKEPVAGNQLFDMLEDKEQKERIELPVPNGFEEQIRWTEEGKLWKFPIDNEQGWEEEANVSFEEHIFLEDLLEAFPKKGPVRHFMELVTTALSKNPYLTVTQKREHIDWYRQYFEEKKTVIEESLVHAEEAKTLEQASQQ